MKIGIVGGGLTGLSAAYYLSKKGHRVVVFEKDEQLGGLASGLPVRQAGFKIGDNFVDKYYRHIFSGDGYIISLMAELGLSDGLSFKKPQTSIFYQERIYPFSSVLDLLKFDPLTLLDRLRFGLVSLYLKMVSDGLKFSSVTAQKWLKKFYGPRSYKIVWEPLLRSKFGEYAFGVSMAWFWSRIHDRSFSLGYLQGGFQILVDRLRKEVERQGSEFRLGVPVTSVSTDGNQQVLVSSLMGDSRSNKKEWTFDKVVVTTPLPTFLDLVGNLPADYLKELWTIQFRSALSMVLVLKKSFMKPYWLNVNDEGFPFVAVVEHTNFIPSSGYGGKTILYLGSYLDSSDEQLKMSDEELFDLYLPHLQKIKPEFNKDWVERRFVFKDNFAQPIVTTDYASKIPPLETPLKNVYLATMAQVYPQDRGMNQAVLLGKNVAEGVEA